MEFRAFLGVFMQNHRSRPCISCRGKNFLLLLQHLVPNHRIMFSFDWQSSQAEACVALANVSLGFIVYWFLSQSPRVKKYFERRYATEQALLYEVLFQRYCGFVFLGFVPALLTFAFVPQKGWAAYGVQASFSAESAYWILGLSALIIPINYLNAPKADNLAMYPQIRLKQWSKWTFVHEYSSWAAYLVAYELLFRGFLLFGTLPLMGAWTAMVLNTAIYALVHVPKGQKEAIGAIPLGLLLSYITLQTGEIWVALVVHVVLAWSNSFFSFRAHPDMRKA